MGTGDPLRLFWETLGFTELVLDIWVVAGTLLAQTSQKRPALSIRAVHPVQLTSDKSRSLYGSSQRWVWCADSGHD